MKKRFIPLLALLLSLCILVPVSIAQSAAEGAVQISVIATGGSVEIADHAVAGGSSYNVEENATVSIKAVPQDGYVFDSWSVTSGGTIAEDELKKNPATLSVTTEAVTLTAKFQKTLTVTLNQAEGGAATIMPTENAVGYTETTVTGVDDSSGDMVATLTATANDGYAFSGWKVTYLKNGKVTAAYAKGDKTIYQYVRKGNLSDKSIEVGFHNNGAKQYANYHVSLIVTPQFTKQLDVTIEQSVGGTVTSSDTLTSLASGAKVTLTATPNEGYGVLGWNVTDKDGNTTSDYTLKMANDTATITLGNTSLKVSAQFSTDAGKFVVDPTEKNPPAPEIREGSTNTFGKAKVSGWNNNKNDDLVMTIVPTKEPRSSEYAYLYMPILQSGTAGYADGAKLTFSDDVEVSDTSSESIKNIKFKADCAHPWEEIPFTITDVNSNVKQAKIVLDYPSKGTVSIEGTGKVTVNGSEYANGDVVKAVTGAELKLQATEASTFAGWEVSGTDITLTKEQATANPLTINAPEGSFTIKAKFQTGDSDNVTVQVKLMEGTSDRSSDQFWEEGAVISRMFGIALMNDKSFDDLVAGGFYGSGQEPTAVDNNHNVFTVEKGQKVCVKFLDFNEKFKSKVGYVLESLASNIPDTDIIGQKTVSESFNGGTYEVTYLAFYARQDIVVTGNIHELYNVEIKASTNNPQMGRVELTPTSSTNLYKERTTLLMSAIPEDGCVFKGWTETGGSYLTEAQKSQMTVQFVVGTKNTQFTATFEEASEITPLPITVNVDYSDKAVVTVNGSRDITSAKPGTQITVAISDVDEYYLFDHWEITQNGVENADPLFPDAEKKNTSVTFWMPSNAEGITIHAVMKERLISVGSQINLGDHARSDLASFSYTVNGKSMPSGKDILKKGDICEFTITLADPEHYVLKEIIAYRVDDGFRRILVTTNTSGSFAVDDWYYSYSLTATLEEKTEDNARHDIVLTQATGGTITSSNSTAQPNTTVTLTAAPDRGYTLKSWIVKDEQQKTIAVTADKTNSNVGTFTMPKSNVTVTAEFESTSEITPTITSVALVKSADGSLVVNGVPSGDNWTITIPNTVSAETVAKIPEGLSGLNLKIETPTGVTVKQMDGGGSYEGDWSKGDIMCWMPVNEEVSFRAIAGTATKDYTIKLVYAGSPLLSNGSATRSSKTAATVTFTSNVAGTYYYKVVDHNAAAPTVDEIKKSTSGLANAGTATTITISNLTEDARDVYIVVVAADGESAPLKIEIPAYEPNPGKYTITVKAPKGGTITPSRTRANAGDEIIVTVTPDSGYQMVADSLTYTLAIKDGETVKITNNRFTMPEGNVTISCQWETAATTAKGITAFSINGVAGAVNNTTNTITITMPRGTDVTKLTPVIATNGVKSLTPGSGVTMDFTNAVTYTATMEDGSTKTYIVTVYVNKGTLSDQFWDKMTDFTNQVPWWEYAKNQQSTSSYPKYW